MKNKIPVKNAEKDLEFVQEKIQELVKELAIEGQSHLPVEMELPSLIQFRHKSTANKTNNIDSKQIATKRRRDSVKIENSEMGYLEGISDDEGDKEVAKTNAK